MAVVTTINLDKTGRCRRSSWRNSRSSICRENLLDKTASGAMRRRRRGSSRCNGRWRQNRDDARSGTCSHRGIGDNTGSSTSHGGIRDGSDRRGARRDSRHLHRLAGSARDNSPIVIAFEASPFGDTLAGVIVLKVAGKIR
jgi:hypothetical protein